MGVTIFPFLGNRQSNFQLLSVSNFQNRYKTKDANNISENSQVQILSVHLH